MKRLPGLRRRLIPPLRDFLPAHPALKRPVQRVLDRHAYPLPAGLKDDHRLRCMNGRDALRIPDRLRAQIKIRLVGIYRLAGHLRGQPQKRRFDIARLPAKGHMAPRPVRRQHFDPFSIRNAPDDRRPAVGFPAHIERAFSRLHPCPVGQGRRSARAQQRKQQRSHASPHAHLPSHRLILCSFRVPSAPRRICSMLIDG